MSWRRLLWLSMSALLAWGLYLYLPAMPRWTLPEYEVPLQANATRMLTMVLDPFNKQALLGFQQTLHSRGLYGKALGPLRLRHLQNGDVLAEALAPNKDWRLQAYSADFRFVVFGEYDENLKTSTISVHDCQAGTHWLRKNVGGHRFSPRGMMIQVWPTDCQGLLDSATGQPVVEVGPDCRLEHFAADDTWALFTSKGKGDDHLATHWQLWQRDGGRVTNGVFPGVVYRLRVAPDGRTAAIQCRNPDQLLIWNVVRGQPVHVLKSSAQKSLAFVFSTDSSRLAVWADFQNRHPRSELEVFDVATGKGTSVKTASRVRFGAFSRDNRLFYYNDNSDPQETLVIDVATQQRRWHRTTDFLLFSSSRWLDAGDNRLLVRYSNPFGGFSGGPTPTGALVLEGESGRELFSRPRGDLSADSQVLFLSESTTGADAYGVPEALLRWLPWIRGKKFVHLSLTRIDTGQEVFRRAEAHPAEEVPPSIHSPYYDGTTLVLMCPGRDTEIWDLPPAKRWAWILGSPVVMVALPWLWRFKSRKQAAPTSAPISQPTT